MSKNRRKAEEENRRRFEVHAHAKGVATKAANHQREVQLGKERANGLHPVRMESIADQLDEVDPKVRGAITSRDGRERPPPPGSPAAFRQLHQEPFIPPQFQPSLVREKTMSLAAYVSSETVVPTKQGFRKGAKNAGAAKSTIRLKIPNDIARRLADRLDGLEFEVELNDDGILFKPAGKEARAVSLPAWVPLKK